MPPDQSLNICCIGAGYVGGPTSAVIAHECPHHHINVVDLNPNLITKWQSSALPIHEPGLRNVLRPPLERGNLTFSTNVESGVRSADVVLLAVNTPTKVDGEGKGLKGDTKFLENAVVGIAKVARDSMLGFSSNDNDEINDDVEEDVHAEDDSPPTIEEQQSFDEYLNSLPQRHQIIVEKSTVPVRTATLIRSIIDSEMSLTSLKQAYRHRRVKSPSTDITEWGVPPLKERVVLTILSNPEFLAEGTAVTNLRNPDRILIGHPTSAAGVRAFEMLKGIYTNWVPEDRIIGTFTFNAELAKLVSNALLAQRVSNANAVAQICQEIDGCDVQQVMAVTGKDSRIGSEFMKAGVGFGGSCFKKDILSLVYLCHTLSLPSIANYFQSIITLNTLTQHSFLSTVESHLGTLHNQEICVLGFAFKANTGDTRESPAINVVKGLLNAGAQVRIFDPEVTEERIRQDIYGGLDYRDALATRVTAHERNASIESNHSIATDVDDSICSGDLHSHSENVFPTPPESPFGVKNAPRGIAPITLDMKKLFLAEPKEQPVLHTLTSVSSNASLVSQMEQDGLRLTGTQSGDPLSTHASALGAAKGVSAVLILTEWEEFKKLDWNAMNQAMHTGPRWIFDGRRVVVTSEEIKRKMEDKGWNVWAVGMGRKIEETMI